MTTTPWELFRPACLGSAFDDSTRGKAVSQSLLRGAVVICAHGYLNGQTPQTLEAVWQTRQDINRFQNSITSNYQLASLAKGEREPSASTTSGGRITR